MRLCKSRDCAGSGGCRNTLLGCRPAALDLADTQHQLGILCAFSHDATRWPKPGLLSPKLQFSASLACLTSSGSKQAGSATSPHGTVSDTWLLTAAGLFTAIPLMNFTPMPQSCCGYRPRHHAIFDTDLRFFSSPSSCSMSYEPVKLSAFVLIWRAGAVHDIKC